MMNMNFTDPSLTYPTIGGQGQLAYSNFEIKTAPSTTTPAEDELLLRSNGSSICDITEMDLAVSACNHVDSKQRVLTVRQLPNGNLFCDKCKAEIKLVPELPVSEIEKLVDAVANILNNVKIYWSTAPQTFSRNLYTTLAFLKKLPTIWPIVTRESQNYMTMSQFQPSQGAYQPNYFNQPGLSTVMSHNPGMINGNCYAPSYPQAPQYQYQNPQFAGAPGYPVANPYAPAGYGQAPMPVGGMMMPGENPLVQQAPQPQPQQALDPSATPFNLSGIIPQVQPAGQTPIPGGSFSIPQPGQPVAPQAPAPQPAPAPAPTPVPTPVPAPPTVGSPITVPGTPTDAVINLA